MALLECRSLTKCFGKKKALDNVDLTIESGKIVGLLGPNGSGKTTFIKIANGLLTKSSGQILIDGHAPGIETKKAVSYLPDRITLPEWMNAEGLMNYYRDFFADFRKDAAKRMLSELGIDTKQPIKALSKGTREKVQLIMTMSRKAKLYLLDEPIGGVDPATRDYIIKTIITNYDPEASVIISTHLIADVEKVLDEVVFLKDGKVSLTSTADGLREEYGKSVDEVFREVFRCSAN